jgi:monoamine oxidase
MKKAKNRILAHLLRHLNKAMIGQTPHQPSRRKFIANGAIGTVGLGVALSFPTLASSCKNNAAPQKENAPKALDVAILGGGIAGLNCANHLLPSNLNFKVFEASKRLGGRILTHYNDSLGLGIFPEFGGDFIDSDHEDMLALAKEFNIQLIDLEEEMKSKKLTKDIYFFDNRKISEREIIKEFKKVAGKIAKDVETLGENYDTEAAIALDAMPLADYFSSLKCAQWLKDLLSAAYVAEFGLDCSEQSSLNFLDMIDTETAAGFKVFGESDERYRLVGGNSKIIEGLTSKIGEDKIERNHEVTEINETENGLYQIKFGNGKQALAKQVVCTIPFTILRKLPLNLKNMPPEKRKCIDELGYGTNTKLVLGYEGTPWTDAPNKAMGYLFHKDIANGWDSGQNKTPDNTKGAYVCFFGGIFSQNLDKQSFKNKMAPPTHVWKTELPQPTVEGFVKELDKVFKGSKRKFLQKHVFVNWIDYPYARGSYSCYKTGQWASIAGLEMASVGNFHFAGEHCSEAFQGFMNGGAETGRRAARALVEKAAAAR